MASVGQPDSGGTACKPGLLILTGASHTGKTSVAAAFLDAVDPPAALLSVDIVLADSLVKPPGDPWREIPLAYDLLAAQLPPLLASGWFVVLESTFTYVPDVGAGQFHDDELRRMTGIADRLGVGWLLVQLSVAREVALRRAGGTDRIPLSVVAATQELHEGAALPAEAMRLETDSAGPAELARRLLHELSLDSGRDP